ncbi:hypothetical protein O3G_MSEX005053 [Manduca sexta]|uniref:Peptidase M12A domain-containing protein n=1 Tax=Manduca sexta TaxID=7130 RepID=A0A921YXT7_MANSE|nr:hypothetical protein O3G_MSEX005053 [Manduca sexta]
MLFLLKFHTMIMGASYIFFKYNNIIFVEGSDPDIDYDEEESVSDHAWEDSGKFEGDLILNDQQRRLIVKNVAEGLSRNGLKDTTKRWPNNEVIYYIQGEHFNGDQIQAIQQGIDDIAQASCVKFRPYKKGDRDAVVIQGSRRGCFSQVGYQGGYQILNLSGRHPAGRGCFRHGTVVHELLHTLGFYHMQSSPDRDDYINVIWENILQPARHNFRKYNSFAVSDFGVGYDYDSVLHYSRRAFSANGQDTLVPKQGGADIGQRVGLSDKDTKKLNKMYCDADSDNPLADEDDTANKPLKKKSDKNKPFDGHGIGYHQGKTVVIKLLPTPETYKLQEVPIFHVFDHFSKTPQALSQTDIEGNRRGKEIKYPVITHVTQRYVPSQDIDREVMSETDESEITRNRHDYPSDLELPLQKTDEENIAGKSKYFLSAKERDYSPEYIIDDDLNEAFDRLEKIVKHHVYPSQASNLNVYNTNEKTKEQDTPLRVFDKSSSVPSLSKHYSSQVEGMKSTVDFIEGLYEKRQNDDKVGLEYKPKQTNFGKTIGITNSYNADESSVTIHEKPKGIENKGEEKNDSKNVTSEDLEKHDYNGLYHPYTSYATYAQNAPIIKGPVPESYKEKPHNNNQISYKDKNLPSGFNFDGDYTTGNIYNIPSGISNRFSFTSAVLPFRKSWHNFDDSHDNIFRDVFNSGDDFKSNANYHDT